MTPNKKIDRKALPAPKARVIAAPPPAKAAASFSAPAAAPAAAPDPTASAPVLGEVAAIWSRILGVQGIGPKDNFFDLGGHSLLAVQAHREIKAELGVPGLGITDIFRFPTLGALAGRIEAVRGPVNTGPQPEPAANAPAPAPANDRALSRAEAMARRRDLRARRTARG